MVSTATLIMMLPMMPPMYEPMAMGVPRMRFSTPESRRLQTTMPRLV